MDPPYPSIGKDRVGLDGDVGWIGCCGKRWPALNEGLVVMNSVGTSYGLPGLAMTSGVEDDILVHVQRLVGQTDRVFLGHDRS